MNWLKLVTFFKGVMPIFLKKYASTFILRVLGLAGGVWGWVISFVLLLVWDKVEQELETEARLEDQKEHDALNITKLEADRTAGASPEKIVEDETNLLNGKPNT